MSWKPDKMPADAMVLPLVLQPIAENAVYHGIEPTQAAGEIEIEVTRLVRPAFHYGATRFSNRRAPPRREQDGDE